MENGEWIPESLVHGTVAPLVGQEGMLVTCTRSVRGGLVASGVPGTYSGSDPGRELGTGYVELHGKPG